ncbi:hypothetical protein CPLU01_15065 [Colletotrichum plurivorum]|uniref:Transmembrane protein n=1 Tax=Colletotrichum plurivorum TaxID=2175906 RepID=A0A8H6JEX8_9PEZI|nr:hypothetical protein CPLU01_15065 [Colletotrichum plurivorum]
MLELHFMSNATNAPNATNITKHSIVPDYLVKRNVCDVMEPDTLADADVTGLGVVISFLVSITFSLSAIAAAYFCRWLPENRFGPIDKAFSKRIRSFIPCSSSPDSEQNEGSWKRERRIQAFNSFILAMSDQQLITGFALVITTTFMTFREDLSSGFSVYSFQIATRLGYFSCIVHFCTLSMLHEHFDRSKGMRNFRLGIVAGLLVLLIICMTISESVTFRFNRHVSVKCAMDNFLFINQEREGYTWFSDELVVTFNLVVLILVILLGYWGSFLELCFEGARTDYHYWPRKSLSLVFNKWEDAYERASPGMRKSLDTLEKNPLVTRKGFKSNFDYWALLAGIWVESMSTSLLWKIIWLLFYFAFGMGNFWNFYVDAGVKPPIDASFGQVVPLILVCLPFLSAWEAFSATSEEEETSPRNDEQSPGPSSGDEESAGHGSRASSSDVPGLPTDENHEDITLVEGSSSDRTAEENQSLASAVAESPTGSESAPTDPAPREPADNQQAESEPIESCSAQSPPDESAQETIEILQVANSLKISLRWFQVCTFVYSVGLIVWALMFASVIPGFGAFYVSIMACAIVTGFALFGAAAWFKALYDVTFGTLSGSDSDPLLPR